MGQSLSGWEQTGQVQTWPHGRKITSDCKTQNTSHHMSTAKQDAAINEINLGFYIAQYLCKVILK
jgi:hypothetical protein